MELILSALFLVLNLVQYELGLNKYLFLAVSAVLFAALFYTSFKKTGNFLSSCLIMMCYTWQSSWINIFGEDTSSLQLPWFYVVGAMMALYAVYHFRSCFQRTYSGRMMLIFMMLIIWIHFPLTDSRSFTEGLKNYIMIMFFVMLLFVTFLYHDTMSGENYEHFKSALIWSVVLTSAALIFQYVMYRYANITLFKIEILPSFSGYQIGCQLLMEDHSSATVMLGVGVFYIMTRLDKKNWWYYGAALLIVVASMAMTSRRTSTLTLIAVFAVFVMAHYKGMKVKLSLGLLAAAVAGLMLYFLLITRPVESLSQLFNDNGRFENFADAFNVIKNNPLGIGLDDYELASKMENSMITPHNTTLRWLCLGGIPMGILMLLVVAYSVLCAHRKKLAAEFWAVIYTLVASSFIPDILSARFFVIICAAPILTMQFREGGVYERLSPVYGKNNARRLNRKKAGNQ